MNRLFLSAAVVAAVLGIGAADAGAQARSVAEPNTVTATPFLGVSFGASHGAESSLAIGGAIGYDWTRRLGFEFEIGHVFDVAGDSANLDWSLTNFSGNAVVHFDAPHVTPYATAGLGWELSSPGDDDDAILDLRIPSDTEIAWNFGGGVKYPINQRLLARADLRRFQVNDLAPDHWRFYGGLTFFITR